MPSCPNSWQKMTGHLIMVVRAVALYLTTKKVSNLFRSPDFAETSTKDTPPESWGLVAVAATRDRKHNLRFLRKDHMR